MLSSLGDKLRQTLVLIKRSPEFKKFEKSPSTSVQWFDDDAELIDYLRKKWTRVPRAIIIVEEKDFVPTINLLREKVPEEGTFHFGILVISEDSSRFMKQRSAFSELLDVFTPKEFLSSPDLFLLRAVRLLIRMEEMGRPRVGQQTLQKLNEIFIALSAERNPKQLLITILKQAIDMTMAEGGRLYMIEELEGELYFRLRVSKNSADDVKFHQVSERVSESSICGYVVLTGKPVGITDVSLLRPYTLPSFDKELDYDDEKVKTLLTVPLKNRRNETIAVLQLANKRTEGEGFEIMPAPFTREDESMLLSFGTQAAICLENVDLYRDIEKLFDGFVKASITAIESRDPSTGGHSGRVAKMSVALAMATTECQVGIYRSVRFKDEEVRELNYAALLHDFGKIGVREEVLVKAKKLYPYHLDGIKERIKIGKAAARLELLEKMLKNGGKALPKFEKEYNGRIKQLDEYWEIIMTSNEPSVLERDCRNVLDKLRSEKLLLPDGLQVSMITESEYAALSVGQGSLTENERLEVESHVRHTYQFLKMIPWTRDFRHLTEIAYAHHEKLDGSGYPRNLTSHEIPLQSKIMTITDIFDALTASDRWYKDAVSTERAIEILGDDVTSGKLDPVLYELFVENKIYELNQLPPVSKVA